MSPSNVDRSLDQAVSNQSWLWTSFQGTQHAQTGDRSDYYLYIWRKRFLGSPQSFVVASSWPLAICWVSRHLQIERREQVHPVKDDEADPFQLFVSSVYYVRSSDFDGQCESLKACGNVKAWVMGGYLDIIKFKNFAMRDLKSLLSTRC